MKGDSNGEAMMLPIGASNIIYIYIHAYRII